MAKKKKVFVSFDFENDRFLKEAIIEQAKNQDSRFEAFDHSLKEAAPEREWLERARAAITGSDVVIVMLGPKTKNAPGVLKEVKIANDLKKERFQLIGYREGAEQWAVPDGGRTYKWTWENLKNLLA
jgi:hypothetical protein